MYEDIIGALAVAVLFLQWRSNKAENDVNRAFYSLMAIFFAVLLMATAVAVAGQYGAGIVAVVTAVYFIMMIVMILAVVFFLVWLVFLPILPKKYWGLLRVFW